MTNLLIRLAIKNPEDVHSAATRGRYGLLAGAVGLFSNALLFLAKLLIGLFTGSISILADAVNNFSDGASSAIMLIGFKLSGMPADDEHPYGHARFEYISGLVVSFMVLVIGWEFLTGSVRKILKPEPVAFTWAVFAVLAVSILVKLWQGMFNAKIGGIIGSVALAATAQDSRNDVITTAVVLLGALIERLFGLRLDGVMGVLVALFILFSGVRLVRETIGPLLGLAPEKELVATIHDKIVGYESVIGMHDLVVHNYGPGRCFASVHVEVPASQDIMVSHDIIDRIERDFANGLGIELVIHLDPIVTDDERTSALRAFVEDVAQELDPVLSVHDFRMVEGVMRTNLIFDVVVPPRYRLQDNELRSLFRQKVKALSENYFCVITVDRSYTSTR